VIFPVSHTDLAAMMVVRGRIGPLLLHSLRHMDFCPPLTKESRLNLDLLARVVEVRGQTIEEQQGSDKL
jgi:hypothetical protein